MFQKAGAHAVLVKSHAKVNLSLEVLARRPDGYHDIRTVMVPLDLYDTLHITVTGSHQVEVSCGRSDLPTDQRNLAYKAGFLMLEVTGSRRGVRIQIKKRIPIGAGLGGGSSNAASTLVALNELLDAHLSRLDLMKMAARLGADVPFFVFGRPALATGVGEELEEVTGLPRLWFVLVYPGIRISTQWAYQKAESWLTSPGNHTNISAFSWDPNEVARLLKNDLERGVVEAYPLLQWIKEKLLAAGAAGAMMSGSGSTVYGLFFAREAAEKAYKRVKEEFEGKAWDVFLARSSGY